MLDTPGIRELRVWTLDDGLDQAFPETHELAQGCRFGICRHDTEPGRAVRAAEVAGRIDSERRASFMKLQAEAAHQMRKTDVRAQQASVSEHTTARKPMKYHHKFRRPERRPDRVRRLGAGISWQPAPSFTASPASPP